jgi:hypothetical protein
MRSLAARPRTAGSTSKLESNEAECIIEHEDRGFEGSHELLKRGFIIARDVLRPYRH